MTDQSKIRNFSIQRTDMYINEFFWQIFYDGAKISHFVRRHIKCELNKAQKQGIFAGKKA